MNEHLSAGQLSEWMAGERSSASERHLNVCADCRSRLEEFQAALAGFRISVWGWSEAQYQTGKHAAWRGEHSQPSGRQSILHKVQSRFYWAAIATAFCALMAILVFHGSAPRQLYSGEAHSSVHSSNPSSNTDAALMRQVDTEVSQTVPDAMEPLMKLVSWDDSALAASKESSKKAE